MHTATNVLPHVDAALNAAATALLVLGYGFIRRDRRRAHQWTMLAAFGVSLLFLTCYLVYHSLAGGGRRFPPEAPTLVRYAYYLILLSHVLLAMAVPPLALAAIWHGWRGQRQRHRRIARWALPVWLYVSVTGVMIYLMLYQIFVTR